jgi:hypothetical protein
LETKEIVMNTFAEFEKSVERAVCMFVSLAITTVLVLWAVDARSSLQDAISVSAMNQVAAVVASVEHGSVSQEV